jgi:hypothetical protein
MVTFVNPFRHPVSVAVELQTTEREGVFELMTKRASGVVVPAFGQLALPFVFHPARMSRHEALLVVSSEDGPLTWR